MDHQWPLSREFLAQALVNIHKLLYLNVLGQFKLQKNSWHQADHVYVT
jgi:hypothetical protein